MIIQNYSDLAKDRGKINALKILIAGLESAMPQKQLQKIINSKQIRCGKKTINLTDYDSIYLVAFGKAADSMANAVSAIINIKKGIVVIPKDLIPEIKNHPYYENIDWNLIETKMLIPPPIPKYCSKKNEKLNNINHINSSSISSKDKSGDKTSNESSVTIKYHSLEEFLTALNYDAWLEETVTADENEYFNSWDYTPVSTIQKEIENAEKAKSYQGLNC
jgi:hypothetical protein